jgi:hypothetical protein
MVDDERDDVRGSHVERRWNFSPGHVVRAFGFDELRAHSIFVIDAGSSIVYRLQFLTRRQGHFPGEFLWA